VLDPLTVLDRLTVLANRIGRLTERAFACPGSAAAAAAAAASATAAARGRRTLAGPAADRDRGQQLDGVVVSLRARARRRRFAHRAGPLERVTAGAAAVIISGHAAILFGPAYSVTAQTR
jgi:hypothetical protein